MNDYLGERIKKYESVSKTSLTIRTPVIIRLDGKSFSSYTKGFDKPWSILVRDAFIEGCKDLFKEVSGLKLCYQQSDELSLLLINYATFDTQPWFMNDIQKMVSVSSSILTASFNKYMWAKGITKTAYFDSRAFCVPKEEVCNVFLWRENDCSRNSVSVLAQKHFSPKQLHKKSTKQMQEMLFQEKGINWNDCETWQKRGYCVSRNVVEKDGVIRYSVDVDWDIPIFSQNRDYINKYVYIDEAEVKPKEAEVKPKEAEVKPKSAITMGEKVVPRGVSLEFIEALKNSGASASFIKALEKDRERWK
jgi:tRNA(His) 5'-end guanylyltransferase